MRSTGPILAAALLAAILAARSAAPGASGPPASPAAATPHPTASPVGVATVWGTIETPGAVAVSLLIRNDGRPDRLLAASSPLAARVDLHRTAGHGRDRAMTPLTDGIPIPAGLTFLDAGGDHPMLVDLRRNLAQGDEFPLSLRFAEAGEVTVTVRVRRRLDAAGLPPQPPARAGALEVSLASAPPAGLGSAGAGSGSGGPGKATPAADADVP